MFSRELVNTLENKVKELEDTLKSLKRDNNILESSKKTLQGELEILKDTRIEEIEGCSFEIDFRKLKAFSIERMVHDKREKTGVGYLKDDGTICEWYFTCSRETHARLAEQFKKQILDIV